jgi:hypothetical protein
VGRGRARSLPRSGAPPGRRGCRGPSGPGSTWTKSGGGWRPAVPGALQWHPDPSCRGARPRLGHIPFTPRAKKVLELSLREALALKDRHIGTEHLLLGLIREGEGLAMLILTRLGAGPQLLRARVLDALRSTG